MALSTHQRLTVDAYIALGSNLGDRQSNIGIALQKIAALAETRAVGTSRFLDNPAVGGPSDSPPFLNAVTQIETSLSPKQLLRKLLEIEQSLGRERREKWGPRTIDLDLLLYGNETIVTDELTVPHPRMHERRFVLIPLGELSPQLIIPGQTKSIRQLLDDVDATPHADR